MPAKAAADCSNIAAALAASNFRPVFRLKAASFLARVIHTLPPPHKPGPAPGFLLPPENNTAIPTKNVLLVLDDIEPTVHIERQGQANPAAAL